VSATQKKITSIFFILLGFVPMLFVLVFVIRQQSIRERMKERLEEEMLHTVTIPLSELHWTEKNKEILVHGRMFDVKSLHYAGDKVILRGLYDDEETALNKSFSEGWKKKASYQRQLLAHLFQCLRGFYCNSTTETLSEHDHLKHLTAFSFPSLMSQFKLILTPPPRC
jgi:hypothetical protein